MSDHDDPQSTTSIQLLSTQQLRILLDSDADAANALQAAADGKSDGMVGIDESGKVEVLEKSSLDSLMSDSYVPGPRRRPTANRARENDFGIHTADDAAKKPKLSAAAEPIRKIEMPTNTGDDLELVDTRMLRVILDEQLVAEGKQPKYAAPDPDDGNPYNTAPKKR